MKTNSDSRWSDSNCLKNTIIITASLSLFCTFVFVMGIFCGLCIWSRVIENRRSIISTSEVLKSPTYEDIPSQPVNRAAQLELSGNMAYGTAKDVKEN